MFGWSHNEFSSASRRINPDSKHIKDLRRFYHKHGIDTFIIDEVNTMSATSLALLHEVMTVIFNPQHKVDKNGDLLPSGGMHMIFLGDPAQLRPVAGAVIYDAGHPSDN